MIIVLKGLPASGKSTQAKKLVADNPGKYKRINKDELRAMLDVSHWSKTNEKFVLETRDFLIRQALKDGLIPIVDDTNLHPKHIEKFREIAEEFNSAIQIMDFDTPVFECIKRDLQRHNPVGGKVIVSMFNQFVRPTIKTRPELPNAIICDIDGTIAKMNGRHPFEWHRVGEDIPQKNIIEILKKFAPDTTILLMSGRDGVCRPETEKWLLSNDVPFAHLFMRGEGDNRKDDIVKMELYETNIQDRYNIRFVLDDRNQVVDMWRSIGLTCLQVDYGDF